MTFGEKLQKLRKKQGWTQEELAERIDVSRQALSKWESEKAMPDTEHVLRISRLFGVSTDYLLKDEYESENGYEDECKCEDGQVVPDGRMENQGRKRRNGGAANLVIGCMLSALSAIGFLAMEILSSVFPVYHSVAETSAWGETTYTETGITAFLHVNNLQWLFNLCIILFFAGILIAVYPNIRSAIGKKK